MTSDSLITFFYLGGKVHFMITNLMLETTIVMKEYWISLFNT